MGYSIKVSAKSGEKCQTEKRKESQMYYESCDL